MTLLQKKISTVAATLLLLAGCATENPLYPEPKITEDVHKVMALVDKGGESGKEQTYEALFAGYTGCMPSGRQWEEMEPGVIFFSCRAPSGGMLQFIWRAKNERFVLDEVVVTNMADQEWSAMNYRGADVEKMLERVRQNRPVIDER